MIMLNFSVPEHNATFTQLDTCRHIIDIPRRLHRYAVDGNTMDYLEVRTGCMTEQGSGYWHMTLTSVHMHTSMAGKAVNYGWGNHPNTKV